LPVRADRRGLAADAEGDRGRRGHRFYEHHGVDLKGAVRAFVANQQAGEVSQGASTLTMQYVRNALRDSADTPQEAVDATAQNSARKLREMRLAIALEQRMSKTQLLEGYLNVAYFGHRAYGIYAAASVYFSKTPAALTLPEAAMIAGLVQAPSAYDPAGEDQSAALPANYPNTVNMLLGGGTEIGYQAGSTFKLFTMLTALEQGLGLTTSYYAPAQLTSKYYTGWNDPDACAGGHWCPHNASKGMTGTQSMWSGFGKSVNTYWVQLEQRVGAQNAVAMAQRLGLTWHSDIDRRQATPTKARTWRRAARGRSAPFVARAAVDAARCVTGYGAASGSCGGWSTAPGAYPMVGRPFAGKTGTTDDARAAWFIGFTPQLARDRVRRRPGQPVRRRR
jgi:membrane peptidoglycan carboxypeptidase